MLTLVWAAIWKHSYFCATIEKGERFGCYKTVYKFKVTYFRFLPYIISSIDFITVQYIYTYHWTVVIQFVSFLIVHISHTLSLLLYCIHRFIHKDKYVQFEYSVNASHIQSFQLSEHCLVPLWPDRRGSTVHCTSYSSGQKIPIPFAFCTI